MVELESHPCHRLGMFRSARMSRVSRCRSITVTLLAIAFQYNQQQAETIVRNPSKASDAGDAYLSFKQDEVGS